MNHKSKAYAKLMSFSDKIKSVCTLAVLYLKLLKVRKKDFPTFKILCVFMFQKF